MENKLIITSFEDVVKSVINEAQFTILSGDTPKKYIRQRKGKGGKTFSYVPHGYVTAVLNQAFGFDWDVRNVTPPGPNGEWYKIIDADLQNSRVSSLLVNMELTIRIHDAKKPDKLLATIVKTATGEREFFKGMSWGSLVKAAEADGFKKCASKLGVALDLYWQDEPEPTTEQLELIEQIKQHANGSGDALEIQQMLKENNINAAIPDIANAMATIKE